MLTEDLRARIAALNRAVPPTRRPLPPVRGQDLESQVEGRSAEGAAGPFYLVRRPISAFDTTGLTKLAQQHQHQQAILKRKPPFAELDTFAHSFPARVLYLDLETCGFSGAPLFLIGLLRQVDGDLVVEQLLARNYAEERGILSHLWALLPDYDVLITFNGKAFDWPFVMDRSTVHRLLGNSFRSAGSSRIQRNWKREWQRLDSAGHRCPATHCDLLHLARRHWKEPLGLSNCKLQTLEAALCHRYRSGDIPGHQIPDAYHSYVRTGDARQLFQIIEHNALDLITLAQLSLLLVHQLIG